MLLKHALATKLLLFVHVETLLHAPDVPVMFCPRGLPSTMLSYQIRDLLLDFLSAKYRPSSYAGLGDEDAGDMRQQFVPWADALLAKLTPQGAVAALPAAAKGRGRQAAVAVVAADAGAGAQYTQNGNGHAGDSGSAAGDDGAISDAEEEGEEGDNFEYDDEEDDEGAGSEVGGTRSSMGTWLGA